MKTAEEWICGCLTSADESLLDGSYVRAIQLDARKQGMRDAAKQIIFDEEPHNCCEIAENKALDRLEQKILTAADNLKEV